MNVWLVRHGATIAPDGVAVGWTDVALADAGFRQARELARRLAPVPIEHVHSSDLRRAVHTAELIARPHGLAVRTTPELREIDFGDWEGRMLADLWKESRAEASAWEADLTHVPSSFGERFSDLEARVSRFATRLHGDGGTAVVVAHRGPLAVLRALLTSAPVASVWTVPCEPGSLNLVEAA